MGRELKAELAEGREVSGDFFRQAGKAFVEPLLAAEVSEALGRERHQRREDAPERGYRNGYKVRQLRTGEGKIEVEVPQVRGLEEPYRSSGWGWDAAR